MVSPVKVNKILYAPTSTEESLILIIKLNAQPDIKAIMEFKNIFLP